MASWADLESVEPDFATRVRHIFELHKHKTLATLRADGSPRISSIEAEFSNGEIYLGMMPGSVKVADLLRDPRLALHSGSEDPPEQDSASWSGDAKIAGRAIEVPHPEHNRFRIDVNEVVLIRVGRPADHLVIESWHEGRGLALLHRR